MSISRALVTLLGSRHFGAEEGVEFCKISHIGVSTFRRQQSIGVDGDRGMVAFVGKERRDTSGSAWSIVISKFRKWEEVSPVVLLVVAIDVEVLFQSLVSTLGLTITFRMVTRGKVQSDVESLSE